MCKQTTNPIPSQAVIRQIKTEYPEGTRIMLQHMVDPYPVPDHTSGTVTSVDDWGQIHVAWDNGSSLALVKGVDTFSKIVDFS